MIGPASVPDRVLLVDDDEGLLKTYRRCLRRSLEVETALGPHQALSMLECENYPVEVSDLNMPGLDGMALLARVQARWPDTIAIMLTGQGDLDLAETAVRDGRLFRVLTKPHPMQALVEAVTDALECHRQRKHGCGG